MEDEASQSNDVDRPPNYLEREPQLGMQELVATHESLLRVVAEEHAVDLVEIDVARGHGIGDGPGAGLLDRPGDAVGGARMGLQDVELVGLAWLAAQLGFEPAVGLQSAQKTRHGARVVAGPRHVAHPE